MVGISTGEAKSYATKRTTGIVDPDSSQDLRRHDSRHRLKNFQCVSGGKEKNYIIETTACTVAVFDYDDDGRPDIYFLNGSTIDIERGGEEPARSVLFRNLGGWKFEDVTGDPGLQMIAGGWASP